MAGVMSFTGVSRRGCLRAVLIAVACAAGACTSQPRVLTLGTTTSVANSGLLDVIAAAYQQRTGVSVRSHLVGSGRALAMLDGGEVDAALTHAPAAEATALRDHPAWQYVKVMFNDFIVVGPRSDPAGARQCSTAVQAMHNIAASGARFISRGDGSGTHERELALWGQAGIKPATARLVVAGAGMGTTLRIAAETQAYTLTDRATFTQQDVGLAILVEHDPVLINTYAVLVNTRGASASEAARFSWWLADGAGRDTIAQFRVGPRQTAAFVPWPVNRPRGRPTDLP
jgi:tungstate transport system substrate-binding protein